MSRLIQMVYGAAVALSVVHPGANQPEWAVPWLLTMVALWEIVCQLERRT